MTDPAAGAAAAATDPADPELAAEQRYVHEAYEHLDVMREAARRVARGATPRWAEAGRTRPGSSVTSPRTSTRRRLAALDIGDLPLCFGRLDLRTADPGEPPPPLHRPHLGHRRRPDAAARRLAGPGGRALLPGHRRRPMGVVRRRHFQALGRRPSASTTRCSTPTPPSTPALTVVGEGALLAALDRARTGRMGDIVATIQAEQDAAIRADLAGVLVVPGGPGTGNTAVALHRAAFLLYTHRQRLGARACCWSGPTASSCATSTRRCPPSAKKTSSLTTPARCTASDGASRRTPRRRRSRVTPAWRRSSRTRFAPESTRSHADLVVVLDGDVLRLRRRDLERIIDAHTRAAGTTSAGRRRRPRARPLPVRVPPCARRSYRADRPCLDPDATPSCPPTARRPPSPTRPWPPRCAGRGCAAEWEDELSARLRRQPESAPRSTGCGRSSPAASSCTTCSASRRSSARRRAACSPRPSSGCCCAARVDVADVAWTEADLALVDEADALLGPPSAARPRRAAGAPATRSWRGARAVEELGVGGFTTRPTCPRATAGDAPTGAGDADASRGRSGTSSSTRRRT